MTHPRNTLYRSRNNRPTRQQNISVESTPSVDWSRLAAELRADRKEMGRTFRETARLAGVSLGAYQRAEAGGPVDTPNFLLLCAWLDADPRSFLDQTKLEVYR